MLGHGYKRVDAECKHEKLKGTLLENNKKQQITRIAVIALLSLKLKKQEERAVRE